MANRSDFARHLAGLNLSHVDRAVAFLWYYRETQEYDERTASDLAGDLYDEKFPRPNVTRLRRELQRSRFTIKGRRNGSFQIDARRLAELDTKYKEALGVQKVHVRGDVIPIEWVSGTRKYLEQLVYQINGAYESGFFDCCSVLCRRLMESLIIEAYVHAGRQRDIQNSGSFLPLDQLITRITTDKVLVLNRNSPKIMQDVKQLGDTAAHDRTYITPKIDVDDLALRYRRMIQELLRLAGIVK
jgi:hypothetical protein